ncbi:MAG: mechanosensitive ion channel family protein [Bacteroidales bacterium]|jgi:small conductance mechanosensitive channel|nr:mechanosensitive ion channel family protein [Bacteroidales bacterium]
MIKEEIIKWSENLTPWLITHGIKVIFIIIGTYILNRIIIKLIEKAIRAAIVSNNFVSKTAEMKRENTLIRIFSGIVKITIIAIAALMILSELGLKIGPILAGAGIVGLAVGFGGQYLIKDIISGLFIIIENQYRVGDFVKFNDLSGTVEDISLRMSTLRDLDGTVHHIPHGEITKVSNFSKHFSRINLDIGISYNSNLENVILVVNKTGVELAEDPLWKESIIKAPQFLRVNEFADSAIIIKILGETQPSKQWEVSGELRKRLKIAFDKEGIEIPFPQVVVHQAK